MKILAGIAILIGAVLGAVWFVYSGIENILWAVQHHPLSASTLAWGIVCLFLASLTFGLGWLIGWVGIAAGASDL